MGGYDHGHAACFSFGREGPPACIVGMIDEARANDYAFECSTDPSCVCASAQFQADAAACLTEHCTPADLATALQLQQTQCTAGELFFF